MNSSRLHRYFLRRFRIVTPIFGVGLLTPILAGWLANKSNLIVFIVDLASHWQWMFLAGLVVGSLFLGLHNKSWGWLLFLTPLPWLTASTEAEWDDQTHGHGALTVVGANVQFTNTDAAPLVRWLALESPDVVVLQEVSARYVKHLEAHGMYPYNYVMPREDPFGMMVMSRFPVSMQPVNTGSGPPMLDGWLSWHGHAIRLASLHPMPPISLNDHINRNAQLKYMAKTRGDAPVLMVGDFNASPWSNAYHDFEDFGLKRATGLTPTWPAFAMGWMGIPIDMVLVSRNWKILDQRIGPDIGSDHLPVLVRLKLDIDD